MSAAKRQPAALTPDAPENRSTGQSGGSNRYCRCSARPHWTVDATNPLHIQAMTQRCPVCHAAPGQPCQNIARRPLYGDRLHNARTEAP